MKTTFDIPEELLRKTKSAAALRGQSMKEFVRVALEAQCGQRRRSSPQADHGWRAVFGRAPRAPVSRVDAVVAREFSHIDRESWR